MTERIYRVGLKLLSVWHSVTYWRSLAYQRLSERVGRE
jgi:hypothetical protein